MATRAEQYQSQQQRAAQAKKKKKAPVRKARQADRARAARFADPSMDRNNNSSAERKGGPELETSATGKPSRKSTRGSVDSTKRTTNQQIREVMKQHKPSTRTIARRH